MVLQCPTRYPKSGTSRRDSPTRTPIDYHSMVESIPQPSSRPLASRLGDTAHVSPLLRRVCQISGCTEERVGEWLLKSAVLRGASHYQRDFSADLPPDDAGVSDEEVAVALCLGHHPYNSSYLRAAAQLLSSGSGNHARLARLAVMERVEPVLLYIAGVAERYAPDAQPWLYLRQHLRRRRTCTSEALPHWSRFVSQTGVTPFGGGPSIQWLHRRKPVA